MATSVNSITGNLQRSRGANNAYRAGWDAIFSKDANKEVPVDTEVPEVKPDAEVEDKGAA